LWKNYLSTIGLVGMNKACLYFGNQDMTNRAEKAFVLDILDFMREKIIKFQKETGNH
jgi:ribonucleoside-triphosphate reductase